MGMYGLSKPQNSPTKPGPVLGVPESPKILYAPTVAWAYVFRHRLLGEIGRILLQELDDGRCHISCEVVGDPSDPMTTQRAAIFKPLGLELTRQMEAVMGRTREDVGSVDLPPRPPETKEVIESKLIPCEHTGNRWSFQHVL